MLFNSIKKTTSILLILATVAFSTGSFLFSPKTVTAANITAMSDTINNENINANSSDIIKFTIPTTMTVGQTITIAFPAGFNNTGIVSTDITGLTHGASTGLEHGFTGGNDETINTTNGSNQWGITFADGACAAGYKCNVLLQAPSTWTYPILTTHKVIVTIAATHSINPGTTGSKTVTISTPSDSGSFAIPIITNDQVTIDATVAPTITFTNDNPTLHFGNLSSAAPQFASTSTSGSASFATANTFSIATNATQGYTLTYAPAATLTSGTNTIAPMVVTGSASGTAGTPQFGMTATYTGSGTLTTAYSRASSNWKFTTAGDSLVTLNAPTAGDTVAMGYIANISNVTPAGTYTQTNTWIAVGNF